MTGLEALAYLNEKPNVNCVRALSGAYFKVNERCKLIVTTDYEKYEWKDSDILLNNWTVTLPTFSACPDPSKPEVSEYESAKQAFLSLEKFRDPKHAELCASVIDFFEEWYVRKGDK